MMRWLTSTMMMLPLLLGSAAPRPEPNHPRLKDGPFAVDANLVEGKLLACVRAEVGRQMIHTRTWSDPEGDPATVKVLKAPKGVQLIDRPKTRSYTILWTPTRIETVAIVVQVTDQPAKGQPASSVGTILVQVVPRGQRPAPHGCGSPPQ